MTPKEKAQELLNKFTYQLTGKLFAIHLANECVDEIIKELRNVVENYDLYKLERNEIAYWQQVKVELQKM